MIMNKAIEAHRKCCLFYQATATARMCTCYQHKKCDMKCSYMIKFINLIKEYNHE